MRKLFSVVASFFWSVAEMAHAALFGYMARCGLVLHSVYIPNGSVVHIGATYSDETSMTAVSNADPGVATLESSHGIATGNIIYINDSGWSKILQRVIRAGTVAGNNVPLEGIDTSNTTQFPVGSGTGSVKEVLTWTQLTQILEFSGEGGEQQFLPYQFLESDAERRIPTFKSAVGVNIVIADDDTLAGYQLAKEANDDRVPRAVRITKPNGGLIFFSAFITLNPMPILEINQLARAQVTFSLENPEPTKYAS